jgi:glycosyltransferase involved in cell wall biosynthesis
MIAYYFPPMGGVGIQRTLNFTRYLPDYGWKPYILTIQAGTQLKDTNLDEAVFPQLTVSRTAILRLSPLFPWRLRNLISRWLLVVDEQIGWIPYAFRAGRKLIGEYGIKVIYSTSAPYSAHLIGRQLHRSTGLPWVADFRDPWVQNPYIFFPTKLHKNINEGLERSVFEESQHVILNTETTRRCYAHKYPNLNSKLTTLPNGYDSADFNRERRIASDKSTFTIVHLGSIYRGSDSIEYFLSALQWLLQKGLIPADKIKIKFIGNIDKETRNKIKNNQSGEVIEVQEYIPHSQAVDSLFEADLLLFFAYTGEGSELFIPAKLYEYLATMKPILCLSDYNDCTDLLQKTRSGSVVPPENTKIISDQLLHFYRLWESGELKIDPDINLIQTFDRRELTGKLSEIFNSLVIKEQP